jgi:gliding motility-associated-like protein
MRKTFIILLFLSCSLLLHSQAKKVLFIGNSYTFYFDMPQMVADLAASAGDNLTVSSSAFGGWTLAQHSTTTNTLNLINQGGWDYVVLQEYSQNPSESQTFVEENVYPYAQYLDNLIHTASPSAVTIFYMTWGRKDGDAARCPVNPPVCTYIGMDDLTRERYMFMAETQHALISPAGPVWRYIRSHYPLINLYDPDSSHPSNAGSYAVACAFYTTIFRKDPTLLTFNSTLTASDAAQIRNAAKAVVYDSLLTWHIGEYDLDKQAPTIPTGLSSSNITETGFTLSWAASSDNVAVTGYNVYRNGSFSTTVSGTSANMSGLNASTTYAMTVKAKDAAGNISNSSNTLNVTTSAHIPATLTITGVSASNKVYDGTVTASLNTTGASLQGVSGGDNVTLVTASAIGTFANKNIGVAKTVTTSGFALAGADAGNYTLIQPSTTASITTANLTITGITANKIYDRTTIATLNNSGASLIGVKPGDIVTLVSTAATGSFSNKNAGTGKIVTTSGYTISGSGSGNYTLTQPLVSANITTAGLSVSGVTAGNKTYDATTTVVLNTSGANLAGVISGDVVNLISTGASGSFATKNAGNGKIVNASGFTLSGTDAANYSLTQPSTNANITAASVTIAGVTGINRVYNGTTTVSLNSSGAALSGVISGDVVSLVSGSASGTIANKNTGMGKTVSVSGFTLSGADASNYNVIQPSTTVNITAAGLTVTGITANKVYDRNTIAVLNTASAALSGVVSGDAVSLVSAGATGSFSSKTAGTGKTVTTTGFTISGTDSGNYTLTQPTFTANITQAPLTVTGVTASNKTYNATLTATINSGSASISGILGADAVTLVSSGASGAFANKNAGTGKTVITTGFTLAGTDGPNYSLAQPVTTADILQSPLTVTGVTANNRVYNGTTAATLNAGSVTFNGLFAGDVVTLVSSGASGTFNNKNVGDAKGVTTSGFSLGGTDAGNYLLTQPNTSANITAASLTVSGITASNKIYDGTKSALLNSTGGSLSVVYGADNVSLISTGATGVFASKNAGTGKVVTTSGYAIAGSDAGNYTLIQPSLVANITPASLSVTGLTVSDKIYNGTTSASLNITNATISGVLNGDAVTLISVGSTGVFTTKNAGSGITVTTIGFSLSGVDAANYFLPQPTVTGNITRRSLTLSGVTVTNKIYDGTTTATLQSGSATLIGIIGSDAVSVNSSGATGVFSDKNTGTGKVVTAAGFTLGGADSGNYNLIQPNLTADITPKAVTIIPNNLIKPYRTLLTFSGSEYIATGLLNGDIISGISLSSIGAQASAGVGTYIISASGGVNNNYSFSFGTGVLTVNKSTITVTATDKTKVYGSENPALTVTCAGFINNEDISVIDVLPAISTTATTLSNVGTYPIVLTGGSDNNYNLVLINGNMRIAKAPLLITADSKNKVFGEINPDFTISYSGFVSGQGISDLDLPSYPSTDATTDSDAGDYDISLSAASDPNYDFIYRNGILKINRADQVITFDAIPSGLRMTQSHELSASSTSGLPVTFESSDIKTGSIAGSTLTINKEGNLVVSAKQAGNHNWNPAPDVNQSIVTLPTFNNISSLFTPNNDGMNDYWYIPGLESYGKVQVTVYNRFGQRVYESDGYKNDWDGTWNGYPLPSASYYYLINSSVKGFIKGVVNIVR